MTNCRFVFLVACLLFSIIAHTSRSQEADESTLPEKWYRKPQNINWADR